MCGRYSLNTNINDLIYRYSADLYEPELNVRDEIFPTNSVPIVREREGREIVNLKWGFTPSFAKKPLINARAETVDVKPTFKDSFINRRCLIPVTSYFEWEKIGDKKIRRRFKIEGDNIFSIAGIYRGDSFTLLTIAAIDSIKHIHERMPAILTKEYEDIWLNKNSNNIEALKELLRPWDGVIYYE